MTEPLISFDGIPLDDSRIGPLSASRIDERPVAWGIPKLGFGYSDAATEAIIEDQVSKYRTEALQTLSTELGSLLVAVGTGRTTDTLLGEIIHNDPASIPKIAGCLGKLVRDIEPTVEALNFLGILKPVLGPDYDTTRFEINPDADFFPSAA